MAQTYTIRLNLAGDLVKQLERAEKIMDRLNTASTKLSSSGIGTGSGGISSSGSSSESRTSYGNPAYGRYFVLSRLFGSRLNRSDFDKRFDKTFKAFDNFSNNLARNSVSLYGWRRNIVNAGRAVSAFTSSLGAVVPALSAIGPAATAFAAGIAAPVAAGGIALSLGNRVLTSQAIGQAASDRLQFEAARRGLGSGYQRALRDASAIAAQYGIPRASAVSNLNVLSGFQTDTGDLGYGTATNLTRAAAVVSAISSRPFDLVALNLQQILGVSSPNRRDIRELLHQAPILSKYATEDQRSRGQSGDPGEYYKDRDKVIANLNRLVEEYRVPRSAEIRGARELRRRDFYIEAEQSLTRVFEVLDRADERLYKIFNDTLANAIERIDEATFERLINSFIDAIETLGNVLPDVVNFLGAFVEGLSGFTRLQWSGVGALWKTVFGNGNTEFVPEFTRRFNAPYEEQADREYQEFGLNTVFPTFARLFAQEQLQAYGRANNQEDVVTTKFNDFFTYLLPRLQGEEGRNINFGTYRKLYGKAFVERGLAAQSVPEFPGQHLLRTDTLAESITNAWEEWLSTSGAGRGIGADLRDIEDLTKGSKALTINFNGPILEMPTTFNTTSSPEETLDVLQSYIDEGVAHALNLAVHNATRAW